MPHEVEVLHSNLTTCILQGVIFITQSGETREMTGCLQQAMKRNFPTIGVVNAVGSSVANMVSCGTYTFAGEEKAAPSTKSFTNEVICLALISLWFRQVKAKEHGLKLAAQMDSLAEALQRMPITLGMAMRTQSACKKAAKKLAGKDHCFVLGKGKGVTWLVSYKYTSTLCTDRTS